MIDGLDPLPVEELDDPFFMVLWQWSGRSIPASTAYSRACSSGNISGHDYMAGASGVLSVGDGYIFLMDHSMKSRLLGIARCQRREVRLSIAGAPR
jgi:hypothetical protein